MAVVQSEGQLLQAQRVWPTIGITRSLNLFSNLSLTYQEIYRSQPNVRTVVSFLGRNIGQLNIKLYDRISDSERLPLGDHPAARALRRPNARTTRSKFIRALIEDLGIFDNFYALKVRNPSDGTLNLFRIPPQFVYLGEGSWMFPETYRIRGNGSQVEYRADELIHIFGYNPIDPRQGLSPLETLRQLLAEEAASADWREQYWRGAARMSGVIERPTDAPKWSDPARNRFKQDWRSTYTGEGSDAGGTPILEEGMSFKEASFSPKDSEYIAARKLTREEVAAAYHIPPSMVGILEHANFANMKEQHIALYQDTFGPWLDWISEELELQMLSEFPDLPETAYLEFNIDEKLRGSFEEQAQTLQASVGAPWLLRNEARSRYNLPPISGGDELVVPLNVITGGQASPRDSAPQPTTGVLARKALETALVKAAENLPQTRQGWLAKHQEVLGNFFGRQRSAVMSKLGAGKSIDEAFDSDRWNEELSNDLLALSVDYSTERATEVAERFGGEYDASRAFAFLSANATRSAENINETTKAALSVAVGGNGTTGTASRHPRKADATDDTEEDDPMALAAGVFDDAEGFRSDEIALTRVTGIGNFGEHEGASQSGVGYKVWVINSPNPRDGHPDDGETVALGETFSNGGLWPGDAAAGVDETAGCTCSLDFTNEGDS